MKSLRFRAYWNSFHFCRQQWLYSRIIQRLPFSPDPSFHFSPTCCLLLFCLYDSIVEIFHDSKKLYYSDPKKCSRMVGVLSHPLGGEEKTKTLALMSVKPPFLSFFADFCQAKAIGFFLEKRKCGSLEGNMVWDTPMSMRIGTCEGTLRIKWQCLKDILQSLQWYGDQAAKGSPRRPYTESHFITFKPYAMTLIKLHTWSPLERGEETHSFLNGPGQSVHKVKNAIWVPLFKKKFYSNEWKGSY